MKQGGMRLAAILLGGVVLAGCAAKSSFVGNREDSEGGFWLDYSVLNRQEEAALHLEAGDMLRVEVAHEKGTVDVTVGADGVDAIYEGNGLTNLRFILNITQEGDYQIAVTGHTARGSVTFEVIPGVQQEGGTGAEASESADGEGKTDDKAGAEVYGNADGVAKTDDKAGAEVSGNADGEGKTDDKAGAEVSGNADGVAKTDDKAGAETPDSADGAAMYAAYRFALEQLAFEHIYPDGTDAGFDGASGFIEDNHFALYDVNGDGREELIVQFVTAPLAGNVESVYAYREDGSLVRQLAVFPSMKYYDNGLVREDWSHGSALAGDDYWPYSLYRYSREEGAYVLLAGVNMWSKSVDTVDYKGEPYPEDVDAEKAGTVFMLTRDQITETVSKSEYEAWLLGVMGDAAELQIPYQSLTEENIKAVAPN